MGIDVAGVGVPYFDQLISIDVLPVTDNHARTLETSWQYGGKVPTAIVAVARLGYKASIHANVGGIFGRCQRLDFERHGIDCTYLTDIPGTNSAISICLAEKSTGGRSFINFKHYEPTPTLKASELDKDALLDAKWLLISDTDEVSLQAAKWFKEAGKPVVIDADFYAAKDFDKLEYIGHFLASEYAYKNLIGDKDEQDYERNLRDIRAYQKGENNVTVVTLGANGVAGIGEDGKYFRLDAYKVPVIDTTGAGDVFHGAYIAGRLNWYDAEGACQFAQAVSAVKCTKLGGRAAIPTQEQVREFMQTGRFDYPEFDERAAYYQEPPFDRVSLS